MAESVTKTVKIPASKAEDWETYVEENPEVDSLSHLIRLSVQKELNDSAADRGPPSIDEEARKDGEILTALRQLQTSLGDVEDRLTDLEGLKTAEANYDLRRAVFSFLPEEQDNLEYSTWAMTAEEIARKLGADEGAVSDTLQDLKDVTGQASRVSGGSENGPYWFKRAE